MSCIKKRFIGDREKWQLNKITLRKSVSARCVILNISADIFNELKAFSKIFLAHLCGKFLFLTMLRSSVAFIYIMPSPSVYRKAEILFSVWSHKVFLWSIPYSTLHNESYSFFSSPFHEAVILTKQQSLTGCSIASPDERCGCIRLVTIIYISTAGPTRHCPDHIRRVITQRWYTAGRDRTSGFRQWMTARC